MGVVALYCDDSAVSNILAEMLKRGLDTDTSAAAFSSGSISSQCHGAEAWWGAAFSDMAIIQPGMQL